MTLNKEYGNTGLQNNNTLALAAAHAGLPTNTLADDQSDSGITAIYTSLSHSNKKRKLSEDNVRVKQETGEVLTNRFTSM